MLSRSEFPAFQNPENFPIMHKTLIEVINLIFFLLKKNQIN